MQFGRGKHKYHGPFPPTLPPEVTPHPTKIYSLSQAKCKNNIFNIKYYFKT